MRLSFVDAPPTFKNPRSLAMSFVNEMKSQHDPIKKQTVEMKLKIGEIIEMKITNTVISKRNGDFQLYGKLEREKWKQV